MDERTSAETERPGYPEGKVVGSLEPEAVEATVTALRGAGFASDTIDVISADDVGDVESPLERPGLRGFIDRFLLSIGGDLQRIEMARQELAAGRVLVMIPVEDDADMNRAADILRNHGSHRNFHAGRWTVTTLD